MLYFIVKSTYEDLPEYTTCLVEPDTYRWIGHSVVGLSMVRWSTTIQDSINFAKRNPTPSLDLSSYTTIFGWLTDTRTVEAIYSEDFTDITDQFPELFI